MKTPVIEQIQEQVGLVKQALAKFVLKQHEGDRYGPEREYTPQSLKAGIQALLADISGLVKAHNKFVQLSNLNERNVIRDYLANIKTYLDNSDYVNAAGHLDLLKPIIRNYNVRGSLETQNVLEERINRLNAECGIIEENINTTERIKREFEQAEERIQTAQKKLANLDEVLVQTQEKLTNSTNLQNESQENHRVINDLLTDSKSHAENINNFIQRVEKREQQLDKQEQTTTSYQEQLISFSKEREEKLKEAEKLINQARNALGYKTAEGISAAFNERYLEEKKKGKMSLWWLVGAFLFVCSGIGIGIWLVTSTQAIGFGLALSRVTILSLSLSAAWFCAVQYVKHRNTLEDYGYKAVLSKSMVAFLDQLEGEERERYLEMVLLQIHQDPLRKKHDVDTPASKVLGMFGRKRKDKQSEPKEK